MESNCPSATVPNQRLIANWNPVVRTDRSVHFDEFSPYTSYIARLGQEQGENSSQISSFHDERLSETLASFDFPQLSQLKTTDAEQQKDTPSESVTREDDGKQNNVPKPVGATSSNLQEGNGTKEEYIHVRAKRGQATNSHSLAERVRRERISQKMKLLQDLVPGCNKITGKAVMLDEVINYVQSLQCQVEFLSMKLAAVNPRMSFDIENMLSKNILGLRDRSSVVPTFDNSRFCESSMSRLIQPGTMSSVAEPENVLRNYVANLPNMSQISNIWDDEIQNVCQMNYMANLGAK